MNEMDYILCKGDIAVIGSNLKTLLERLEGHPNGVSILKDIYKNLKQLHCFIDELNKKEIENAE